MSMATGAESRRATSRASERVASAKRALADTLAYAQERSYTIAWTDTREEMEALRAPLPLGFTVGWAWEVGQGLDILRDEALRRREPLPGMPLALAYHSYPLKDGETTTRHIVLSEPMARLARRAPATVKRMAEAARECARRLHEEPRLAAIAAYEDSERRGAVCYVEAWLNVVMRSEDPQQAS